MNRVPTHPIARAARGVVLSATVAQLAEFRDFHHGLLALVAFSCGSAWTFVPITLALAAREEAVGYAPILVLAAVRHRWAGGPAVPLAIAAGVIAIHLPFLVADPFFYLANLRNYTSMSWVIEEGGGLGLPGLAGVLSTLGLLKVQPLLWAGSLAALASIYVLRERSLNLSGVYAYAAAGSLFFAALAAVSWPYLYVAPLIVLAVWALHRAARASWTHRAAVVLTILCVAGTGILLLAEKIMLRPRPTGIADIPVERCHVAEIRSAQRRVAHLEDQFRNDPARLDTEVRAQTSRQVFPGTHRRVSPEIGLRPIREASV